MPRVHFRRRLAPPLGLAMLFAALGGCRWLGTGDPAPLSPAPAGSRRVLSLGTGIGGDSVDIVALGVDGFLVVPWRDTTQLVMTPPAFSNPSLWHLMFRDWWWGTRPNHRRLTRALAAAPDASAERLANVRAVLVGHGHYDHALDLPPLLPRLPQATVYGSASVVHQLRPAFNTELLRARLVDVSAWVGTDAAAPGRDVVIGTMLRARPVAWAHAPNIAGWTVAAGRYTADRRTLPRTIHGWRKGEPLAWTLDVLGADGAVVLRIVHHDAAASLAVVRAALRVIGTMPRARHTLVIMTAANWDQADAYPGALLATLAPDHVLLGHWEDFFRSPAATPRVVRGISAPALAREVSRFVGPRWSALAPGATLRLRL